jgi:hypothetical protein
MPADVTRFIEVVNYLSQVVGMKRYKEIPNA